MKIQQNNILIKDISRDLSSYVDPQGFVFHHNEKIYRCIYPESAELFKNIMQNGTLKSLENDFGVVNTKLSDIVIAEKPNSLIVNHEKIWPLSYPVEWCPSMLYNAAKLTLELAIELTDKDLMLQDAYPWNVLYKGTTPVFIDLTSISTVDEKIMWPAHEQFEAFFMRPLVLSRKHKGFVARNMMYDYINGISLSNFMKLLNTSYKILHPSYSIALWLDKKLQNRTKTKERIRRFSENAMQKVTPAIRKRFLKNILKKLGSPPNINIKDPWHSYYEGIDNAFDKEYKIKSLNEILSRLSPSTAVDIGCNNGVFSIIAAKKGINVISLDSSESCIEHIYQIANQDKLPITPLIVDITSPTPAFGYMSEQYPSLLRRIRSECVLFLGIMHHIHLSGRQSFERISIMLDKLTSKYLIFEFVSMEDKNIPHLSQRRDINYNEETVKKELSKYFQEIEILPSDRITRKLFVCKK